MIRIRKISHHVEDAAVFQESLGMRLREAYLTFHRRANAHFEHFGATADQFVILTILADKEGITQRELVDRASSDPNTVGEMLLRLERKNLVRRQPHPSDGRARCVFLTARGRKIQRELLASWEGQLDRIGSLFEPEELQLLIGLLARIPPAVRQVSSDQKDDAVA